MELDLPYGPWKRISSGQWADYPTSIYVNPDKMLLMTVFDRSADESIKGILVLMKKPAILDGDADKLSTRQSKEITIVEKISRDYRYKFLLVESTPHLIPFSQIELTKTIKEQYMELDGNAKAVKELAESFNIKISPLANGSKESDVLLGDPFTLFAMSGFGSGTSGGKQQVIRVFLGINTQGEQMENAFSSLNTLRIAGGERPQRLHMLHIVAENLLLNSVPCLIFGNSKLSGLAYANNDESKFKEFSMAPLASGFPFKVYQLGQGLLIDLTRLTQETFAKQAGFGSDEEVKRVVSFAFAQGDCQSVEDLINKIQTTREPNDYTQYAANKAIRCLKVIQKSSPMTFGKNTFTELEQPWESRIGKAMYVDLSKYPSETKELLMLSVLNSIKPPESGKTAALIFEEDAFKLGDGIRKKIIELMEKGYLTAIHSEHELDFGELGKPTLLIDILGEEAIASESDRQKKRFKIRPAYSKCGENEPAK